MKHSVRRDQLGGGGHSLFVTPLMHGLRKKKSQVDENFIFLEMRLSNPSATILDPRVTCSSASCASLVLPSSLFHPLDASYRRLLLLSAACCYLRLFAVAFFCCRLQLTGAGCCLLRLSAAASFCLVLGVAAFLLLLAA